MRFKSCNFEFQKKKKKKMFFFNLVTLFLSQVPSLKSHLFHPPVPHLSKGLQPTVQSAKFPQCSFQSLPTQLPNKTWVLTGPWLVLRVPLTCLLRHRLHLLYVAGKDFVLQFNNKTNTIFPLRNTYQQFHSRVYVCQSS